MCSTHQPHWANKGKRMFQIHFCFSFLSQVTGFFHLSWSCTVFSGTLPNGHSWFQIVLQITPAWMALWPGDRTTSFSKFSSRMMLSAFRLWEPRAVEGPNINLVGKLFKNAQWSLGSCWIELGEDGECEGFSAWPCLDPGCTGSRD